MAPKKAKEEVKEEAPVEEEDEEEPANPEILEKCFRSGGQLFYGSCKAGYKERKGTFVKHGSGRLVELAVAPAGRRFTDSMAYETVVTGVYQGEWAEDQMCGQGTYKWGDGGSCYKGTFANNQIDGQGRLTWPDKSSYDGEWREGRMHGMGRYESRPDGQVYDGRFHENCYQTVMGEWVDILDKARKEEQKQTLQGDHESLQVHRVAFGEWLKPSGDKQVVDAQKKTFVETLGELQRGGLVPFVVAEEAYGASTLECLTNSGLMDPAKHAVTVRVAAVAKRRRRDCDRLFFDAIQDSLRSGSQFVMAFEDDDAGTTFVHEEKAGAWWKREPAAAVPTSEMPEDWRLSEFYNPAAFPTEVFQPRLFNGRGLAGYFLPEAREPPSLSLPAAASAAASAGGDAAAPAQGGAAADGLPAEEQLADPASQGAQEFRDLASQELKAEIKLGLLGQTGKIFDPPPDTGPEAAGMRVAYCLRPVVCALGRVPGGLSESDLRGLVAKRFGRHLPLHCLALLVLGDAAEEPTAEEGLLT